MRMVRVYGKSFAAVFPIPSGTGRSDANDLGTSQRTLFVAAIDGA